MEAGPDASGGVGSGPTERPRRDPFGSVAEMLRHRYDVTPSTFTPAGGLLPNGLQLREPVPDDHTGLAALMLSAYVGTIDYEGETLADAGDEVARWFANEAYRAASLVALERDHIVGGVLNSLIDGVPLIGYVMTSAERKGMGIAGVLVETALQAIFVDGHRRVSAWITEGNVPSERLFTRLGFVVVDTFETDPT
jgi:RimJ/RimL family protein N-acetyltransferase